jgi:hypothetical protein
MYRKRQRGGNFKGKEYQRSKQQGGNIIGKIKNSKVTKTLRKHMLSVGQKLGLLPTKKMIVQKGGSMRRMRQDPPRCQRNTIPSAKYVMYHR